MSKNQMLKQTRCSLVFCSAGFIWVKGFTSRRRTLLLSICSPVHLWNAPSGLQPFLTEEGPESIRAPTNLTPPSIPHPAGRPFSNRQTGWPAGRPAPFMASQTNERASSDACDPENSTCSSWFRPTRTAAALESP